MLEQKEILYKRLNIYLEIIHVNLDILETVERSIKALQLYPMESSMLVELPTEKRTLIDSFIYRFLIIQDHTSTKLFPLLAQIITSESRQLSWFDILALMEKHAIITSEQEWDTLRKLRNLFSHEYEAIPEVRAQDINRLIEALPVFYQQIQLISEYAKKVLEVH